MAIPGKKKPKLYEKKSVVEASAVIPPIITGVVAAAINIGDPTKRTLGWVLLAAVGWLAVASVVKVLHAYSQDRELARKDDYEGLLGAVHVLYGAISKAVGITDREHGRLRVTLHRVVPPPKRGDAAEELEQLLPYVGGSGSAPGRTFSIRSGIIGKAVREKSVFAAHRESDDYEKFLSELVRDWAYTEADARKLSPDRRSWMAVPILGSKSAVVAVVFLDSNEKDFFTSDIRELVINCCAGIASYINEVY